MVPILPHFSQSVTANRILGGEQGTSFLVCALGLQQPKAHGGLVFPGFHSKGIWKELPKTIRQIEIGL